jgi:hypothetical protein
MLLRDTLPRFYAEAVAAIMSKPDDEFPDSVSRDALLTQFESLIIAELCGAGDRCGSFRVTAAGRPPSHGYGLSFDFDIPSGNVILDLDRELHIDGFEPIIVAAQHDIQSQLDSISSR